MTDADRIAAIVRKAEYSCCNVTIDEIRWLADRASLPLTVGAALALPEVQRGACEVFISPPVGFAAAIRVIDGEAKWRIANGSGWRSRHELGEGMLAAEVFAMPCRLVPLAIADANPATRGEMP